MAEKNNFQKYEKALATMEARINSFEETQKNTMDQLQKLKELVTTERVKMKNDLKEMLNDFKREIMGREAGEGSNIKSKNSMKVSSPVNSPNYFIPKGFIQNSPISIPGAQPVPQSQGSFKEESNKVTDLSDLQKKSLDDLKTQVQDLGETQIYGVPLLQDERSDVILLKFLRARDFNVKEAFVMLKITLKYRQEFGIEGLPEEKLGDDLDKVVFTDGFDIGGHPVCSMSFYYRC